MVVPAFLIERGGVPALPLVGSRLGDISQQPLPVRVHEQEPTREEPMATET